MQNGRTKNIIITIVIAAVLLCVILLAVLPTVPRAHGSYRLTVFFTGDLHGQVDNLPYYYTIIQQARHDGSYPVLLRDARRNKCALLLAERCQCHLVPESEASAKARWQSYETHPAFAHIDLEHERQRLFPET